MVKKNNKGGIEMIGIDRDEFDDDDQFVKADEYLINEVLNEQEGDDDNNYLNDRDEVLIENLKKIDGKKSKKLRTEVVKSELDVNISTRNDPNTIHKIKTHELLNSLKNVGDAGALKKLFSKAHKKTKVLETPLPKFISDKAQRVASYVEDKKEISKWDPVIQRNRKSEQLVFPLKQPDYSMQTASTFTKTWKAETDLEKEIAELLESSENNLKDQKLLTPAELKAIQAMNIEEMKNKRAEFLKLKAMEAFQAAKFKRLKKIKSKRYRKILRKEKEKNEAKNMDKLEKEDPLKFKEVLEHLEKQRMKERMSLKHKNTSKWAKKQAVYAKYNEKVRDELQEQIQISKDLTKKIKQFEYADDDDDEERPNENKNDSNPFAGQQAFAVENGSFSSNPWMKMMSGVGGLDHIRDSQEEKNKTTDDFSRPKAFTDKKELEKVKNVHSDEDEDDQDEELIQKDVSEVVEILNDDEDEEEEQQAVEQESNLREDQSEKRKQKKISESTANKKLKKVSFENGVEKEEDNKEPKEVKPSITIAKSSTPSSNTKRETNIQLITSNSIATLDADETEESNENRKRTNKRNAKEEKEHQLTLSEAFADDDVIDQFKAEKKAIVENERVKPIDLTLPGWGDWAGAGVDPNKAKKKANKKGGKRNRRRLIIRPQDVIRTEEDRQQLVRKDKDLEHVIISEKKDEKIAAFQISELPNKFKYVSEFESKIAQPIGRTWNPDQKFRKLCMPKVKTKLGSIIEPIDKDDLPKNFNKNKRT